MDSKGIFEALQAKFGDDVVFGYEPPKNANLDDHFFVTPTRLADVAKHLRDDPKLDFDYLECLSGVDYPDAPMAGAGSETSEKGTIHVVYHLRSYEKKHRAVVKVSLPRSDPRVTTLTQVWSAANWQERECYDLLGVTFDGHPDLRRIMLPDDWEGHPLRKDYKEKASYHGIPTTRPNPFDLLVLKAPEPDGEAKPEKKQAAKKPAPKKSETNDVETKGDVTKPEKKPTDSKTAEKSDEKTAEKSDEKTAEKSDEKTD